MGMDHQKWPLSELIFAISPKESNGIGPNRRFYHHSQRPTAW